MTTDPNLPLVERVEVWLIMAVDVLQNPAPNQMTALDYAINRAIAARFGARSRGNYTEFHATQDQLKSGRLWLPSYPMGNIVAAVTCDIYNLWR